MARYGYCRHGVQIQGSTLPEPCSECARERREAERREANRIGEIRNIVREEIDARSQEEFGVYDKIAAMSSEEVTAFLTAEGVDIERLRQKTLDMLETWRKRFAIIEQIESA